MHKHREGNPNKITEHHWTWNRSKIHIKQGKLASNSLQNNTHSSSTCLAEVFSSSGQSLVAIKAFIKCKDSILKDLILYRVMSRSWNHVRVATLYILASYGHAHYTIYKYSVHASFAGWLTLCVLDISLLFQQFSLKKSSMAVWASIWSLTIDIWGFDRQDLVHGIIFSVYWMAIY
jgi:hypothetical protein